MSVVYILQQAPGGPVKIGRTRFVGVELKASYFATAAKNLASAEASADTLLDLLAAE